MRGIVLLSASAVMTLVMGSPLVQAAQAVVPPARPALEGAWLLDREASTLPPPGAMARVRPGGSGGGSGGFSGPGMGGSGGGRGSRPSEEEIQQFRDLVQELLQPPARLTITRDGEAVAFVNADGRVRKYVPNGKPEKHQMNAGTVETKTRWEGPALLVETRLRDGMTLKTNFALETGTGRLLVTTSLEGRGSADDQPPIVAVYDPAS